MASIVPKPHQSGSKPKTAVALAEDEVREHVFELLATAHHPDETKAKFVQCLQGNNLGLVRDVNKILCQGWKAVSEGQRSNVTNTGVVAALVLSFVAGMTLELPEVVDADDSWADRRKDMLTVYGVLCTASTCLCVACVLFSIVWVNHCTSFVLNGEDFLDFNLRFPTTLVDLCLIFGVICFAAAFSLGSVLVQEGGAATASFIICMAVFGFILFFYLYSLILATAHTKRNIDAQKSRLLKIIDSTYADFCSLGDGSATEIKVKPAEEGAVNVTA